jgi:hypothetical protein
VTAPGGGKLRDSSSSVSMRIESGIPAFISGVKARARANYCAFSGRFVFLGRS